MKKYSLKYFIVRFVLITLLTNKSYAQVTEFEKQKLAFEKEKFEFETHNEKSKATIEVVKSTITGFALLIPLLVAIYSVRSQIKLTRETKQLEAYNVNEKMKIEERVKYLERQIEQFYGPLFNLINQIVLCNHVQHKINTSGKQRADSEKEKLSSYFQDIYFTPLHKEFNNILKTKLYLIEGSALPDSFYKYLRHSIQENVQLNLWNSYKIDTSDVVGIPYPNEIYSDIKTGLDNAMSKYSELTNILDKKVGV